MNGWIVDKSVAARIDNPSSDVIVGVVHATPLLRAHSY
jgi:hypothetical protein